MWTVFGSSGHIGRAIVRELRQRGETVLTPPRGQEQFSEPLGHVIYAIGLTADFRQHLTETVEAHVALLNRLLPTLPFTSFLYLSSTRVYAGSREAVVDETSALTLAPSLDGVYNGSKLLGESLCMAQQNAQVRVARLSNVYSPEMGDGSFLGMVLKATTAGEATIRQSPETAKDYIDRDDAVRWLLQIAQHGKQRLYNVCSGRLISHADLASSLQSISGYPLRFSVSDAAVQTPLISNARVQREFPASLQQLSMQLPALFKAFHPG